VDVGTFDTDLGTVRMFHRDVALTGAIFANQDRAQSDAAPRRDESSDSVTNFHLHASSDFFAVEEFCAHVLILMAEVPLTGVDHRDPRSIGYRSDLIVAN